jgi:hypothetical protein
MKTISALAACALLAFAAPALAQNASDKSMQQNGSPNGVDPSHAKQGGAPGAESGPSTTEGRSSATDAKTGSGMNPGSATDPQKMK